MGWLFYFTVTFINGTMADVPFNSLDVCREIRQTYLIRQDVTRVSECKEIGR